MDRRTLILGAVAYDPKVVTIWEGFKAFFAERELDFDYVLYSNYERQVEAQLNGNLHVGWSSPLAWLQTLHAAKLRGRTAEAIAMRDTDCDLTSLVLVRSDSPIREVADLRGKTIGVGASDSPQATLIPLQHLADCGIDPERECTLVVHDVLAGKHGDHIGGERDAVRALSAGKVDAACVIDGNHVLFAREGTIASGSVRVLCRTPAYDHCNFTVLDDAPRPLVSRFRELLLSMSYDDPRVRTLLELEGLKAWKPGRTEGYALLDRAAERTGWMRRWLAGI